jgi:aldehyde dehydrogenase (NAD+)
VNGPTIGASALSLLRRRREASHTVLDVFTEWKSVYVDYSGRLQRAQIDTERTGE